MKRALLRSALQMIATSANWYAVDQDIEAYAHELAHAIVTGHGRAVADFGLRLEKMKTGHRNRNELITMATQLEALKRLGLCLGIRKSAVVAYRSLDSDDKDRYPTVASVERFLKNYKPSERNVQTFVRMVKHAAKAIPR